MAGFDPMPAELQAYWDGHARYKAVLRRLGELGVDNAGNRINASQAPIVARDKFYRCRLRLIDMMTSLAREKGVQSLYGELTPSIREELRQIHKIEVEAGTAPPEPEPAIAPVTTIASATAQPGPAIAAATTLEVRTETPPPVLSPEAPEEPKPAPSKPRKRRRQRRVDAAHRAVRAIGDAWEKRILDHLAEQALVKPDRAGEWRLETVLPKQIEGLELPPESPNKSSRTLSLDMAAKYLKRLRDKEP
jgi:hypothetical protein